MRGTVRRLSIPRRLVADLMHASRDVPFVSLRRTLDIRPLIEARTASAQPPGWAAIFARAFGLVARDEPALRRLYLKWPWPHLYELPHSVCMVAIARKEDGEDCVLPQKVSPVDELPLAEVDALIRYAKTAPVEEVPAFRKLLRTSRLSLPLRRAVWMAGLNFGRQRANYFGTFGITSVAAFGPGELHALSPGPFIVSYGAVAANHTIDVVIRWDHRITDAALIARTLTRLEQALNGPVRAELLSQRQAAEPKPVRAVAT